MVGSLVDSKKVKVKMLKTKDQWFGVTYKEDKELVVSSIRNLINNGVYPSKLFS